MLFEDPPIIEDTREKYNNILEKIKKLKSADSSFISPEDIVNDPKEYEQILNKQKEELYNQLKNVFGKSLDHCAKILQGQIHCARNLAQTKAASGEVGVSTQNF